MEAIKGRERGGRWQMVAGREYYGSGLREERGKARAVLKSNEAKN